MTKERPSPTPGTIERCALKYEALERSRQSRIKAWRPYTAVLFILLGLGLFGGEVFRNWVQNKSMNGGMTLAGGVFAFIGFYMLNHQDTKDGATFIVSQVTNLAGVFRLGRRSTDPVVPTPPPSTDKEGQ